MGTEIVPQQLEQTSGIYRSAYLLSMLWDPGTAHIPDIW